MVRKLGAYSNRTSPSGNEGGGTGDNNSAAEISPRSNPGGVRDDNSPGAPDAMAAARSRSSREEQELQPVTASSASSTDNDDPFMEKTRTAVVSNGKTTQAADPLLEKCANPPRFMSVARTTSSEAKKQRGSSKKGQATEVELDFDLTETGDDPILSKTSTVQPLPSSLDSNGVGGNGVDADGDDSISEHTPPPTFRRQQQVSMALPGAYAFGREGTSSDLEDHDEDYAATNNTGSGANDTAQPEDLAQEEVTIVEAFRVPDGNSEEFNAPSSSTRLSSRHESIASPQERELIEQEVRQRILNEAIQAQAVQPVQEEGHEEVESREEAKPTSPRSSKMTMVVGCLVLLILVGLSVVLGVGLSSRNKEDENIQSSTSSIGINPSSTTETPVTVDDDTSTSASPNNNTTTTMMPSGSRPTQQPQPQSSSEPPQQPQQSKLSQILDRGYINCGIYNDVPGFGFLNKTSGEYSGFNFQICRAVAAAVFNNPEQYQIQKVSSTHRFENLTQGSVDLISQTVTQTMGREALEKSTGKGFSFSYPFYFSGTIFGGIPEYVQCADNLDPFNGICRGLKVCITIGSTQERVVNELLPGPVSVRFFNPVDAIHFYNNRTCNVIAAEPILLMPERLYNDFGMDRRLPFVQGNNTFSRDPLSIITSDDDTEWSDLVNSIIKILYTAEAMNITRDNVESYQFDELIPLELQERIRRVVLAVGNIGELYEYTTEAVMPRTTINTPNTHLNTGLMYAYPFGRIEEIGPPKGVTSSATMDLAQERGYLKCGVSISNSTSSGNNEDFSNSTLLASLNMEMCRAIAGALFMGDSSQIELIELDQPFQSLQDGHVDLLVGQEVTLANEFFEPSTGGKSFSFSTPYYYGNATNGNGDGSSFTTLAFVTRRDDNLWNSFVHWTMMAIVYAEEEGITSSNAIDMPIVNGFGLAYSQMFRDCIASVGNYGDIYERTLGSTIPRAGGNLLNNVPFGPQQVAYPLL